jgi:hypothetical protein
MNTAKRSASMEVGKGVFFDVLNPDPAKMDIKRIAHALAHINRFAGFPRRAISVAEHSYHASLLAPPGKELEALLHDRPEGCGLLDFIRPLRSLWKSWDEFVFLVNAMAGDVQHEWPEHMTFCALLKTAPKEVRDLLIGYREIELELERVSGEKFGVPTTMSPEVKEIDDRLCITEKLAFLGKEGLHAPEWAPLTSRYKPYRYSFLPKWLDQWLNMGCDLRQLPPTIYYHWFMWPGRARSLFLGRYRKLSRRSAV